MSRIRNISVIAHIDHGKSTLSDRLLELTNTIATLGVHKQFLDKLKVEQERGITVKAVTCSMRYKHKGEEYMINLIDTPGHVDFRAEVIHSLKAGNGCLLLIDAAQGIQAQTVANFYLAFAENLKIIPVLNKIDLPAAEPGKVLEQLEQTFELDPVDALAISAKTGLGVGAILPAIIERVPPPTGSVDENFKCLLIDSWYDNYKGVILLVRVFGGTVQRGDRISSVHTGHKYEVSEVGLMHPDQSPVNRLCAGMVGYVVPSMKRSSESKIGDTFYHVGKPVQALPGFEDAKPMIYVGAFPLDTKEFKRLEDSINNLSLNDRSITVHRDTSTALGQGWRLGFLGSLHLSVFQDRLKDEYGAEVIITTPTVPYQIEYRDGTFGTISNPSEFPDVVTHSSKVLDIREPVVEATMIFPSDYLGSVIELCEACFLLKEQTFLSSSRVLLKYIIPLAQLVEDFFGKLKSSTKGYATLDYEEAGYIPADVLRLSLLINGKSVDALASIVHRSQAERRGREWVKKMRGLVDRQLYEVVIQAAVGNKVVARESISAKRKDVTAKCYGGDVSRKMKLLNKQKEGKKRMRSIGNVQISQEVCTWKPGFLLISSLSMTSSLKRGISDPN
ncbi:Translation factor GUF1, mitochondrial [Neolecta irregularis DAH-3]|uniref:Translation factor GUF1, mitochondrial n=1 Tax=Neolecta irregularis (strain DAH-3) TaxID=1198029 RepID=A0A1U7LMH5_NEOID|nr:Translation factor GUF1, mitochondrial [Neolecta irregularis DAH-3]|eukprot:OLL23847.1 Translation factor GUF1, mitochondrial [Neolecta irregularis DAH-3]